MKKILAPLLFAYFAFAISSNAMENPYSDHWYYLQMAKEISQGSVAYRDFFFASGPLFLYPLAVFFAFLGASLQTARLYAAFSGTLALLGVYVCGERLSKNTGLWALLLFAPTHLFLSTSSKINGVSETILFSALAIFFFSAKKTFLSANSAVFSLLTRLNALPLAVALFAQSVFEKKQKKFSSGLCAVALPFLLVSLAAPAFFDDYLFYHLGKKPVVETKNESLEKLAQLAPVHLAAWLILPLFLLKKKGVQKLFTPIVALILHLASFVAYSGYYYHYFVFAAMFAAIISAISLQRITCSKKQVSALLAVVLLAPALAAIPGLLEKKPAPMPVLEQRVCASPGQILGLAANLNHVTAYLAFVCGKKIPPNYIDASFTRVQHGVNTQELLGLLGKQETSAVLWDYREDAFKDLEDYPRLENALKTNYSPTTYLYVYNPQLRGEFLVLWEKNPPEGQMIFEKPVGGENKTFLVRVLEEKNGQLAYSQYDLSRTNFTPQTTKDPQLQTHLYSKENLANGHELIKWPIEFKKHWKTEDQILESETWVVNTTGEKATLLTLSREKDSPDYRSLVYVVYDSGQKSWESLLVYTKVGENLMLSYGEQLVGN